MLRLSVDFSSLKLETFLSRPLIIDGENDRLALTRSIISNIVLSQLSTIMSFSDRNFLEKKVFLNSIVLSNYGLRQMPKHSFKPEGFRNS